MSDETAVKVVDLTQQPDGEWRAYMVSHVLDVTGRHTFAVLITQECQYTLANADAVKRMCAELERVRREALAALEAAKPEHGERCNWQLGWCDCGANERIRAIAEAIARVRGGSNDA